MFLKTSTAFAYGMHVLVVAGAVGFAIYYTHSAWSLLGLLLVPSMKQKFVPDTCPKCGHIITYEEQKAMAKKLDELS